jgi:hypothetical protein
MTTNQQAPAQPIPTATIQTAYGPTTMPCEPVNDPGINWPADAHEHAA